MKRAIAYTSDIILGRTGEVIGRDEQRERITRYAAEHDVEIIRWFEDRMYNEEVMERPGVQAMFGFAEDYDTILVERVWSFSRSWPRLQQLFDRIEAKGKELSAATTMWDCISQMSRRRFDATIPGPGARVADVVTRDAAERPRIKQPKRLNFTHLYKTAQA